MCARSRRWRRIGLVRRVKMSRSKRQSQSRYICSCPTTTMEWRPHPGPQTVFHASGADEILYGGAAGGGKSDSLLVEALRYVGNSQYRAIIFRRTYPELEGKGSGLIPRSRELLYGTGAHYDEQQHIWFFSSGATLAFAHLEHEHSVHNYRSSQFAYIAFDELTTFTESQYLYMLSRLRTLSGLPVRLRAASNPGGVGHAWVRKRFIERLKPFEIRFFKRDGDAEIETHENDPDALSRQFIPARVFDNPTLLERDPNYVRRLKALDTTERKRLLDGDWFASDSGLVYAEFNDANITDEEPERGARIELAFDDGYIDPRAILLVHRNSTRILVFAELYHSRHLPETCIAETLDLASRCGVGRPLVAFGSHEAIELRERFKQNGISARGDLVPLAEGIKNLRRLVHDSNGRRLLHVHRRCAHLLDELRSGYRYDPRGGEIPLDQDNHACDALRMWCWHRARISQAMKGAKRANY